MERFLVTLSWTERHVEQVRVPATGAYEAVALARLALRKKHGGRMVQTNGGEDFRAIEVEAIIEHPAVPTKRPKGKWGEGSSVAGHKKAPAEVEKHPAFAIGQAAARKPVCYDDRGHEVPGPGESMAQVAAWAGLTVPCRERKPKEAV